MQTSSKKLSQKTDKQSHELKENENLDIHLQQQCQIKSEETYQLYQETMSSIKVEFNHRLEYQRLSIKPLYNNSAHPCFFQLEKQFKKRTVKRDKQSYICQINMKKFIVPLCVLRLPIRAQVFTKFYTKMGGGQFGQIFHSTFRQQKIAIKSIKLTKFEQSQIDKILYEVAIAKIASQLRIGPYMDKYFGYDVIIFLNSVQFDMQYCFPLEVSQQKHLNRLKYDMLQSLKLMHQHQICHMDIKTDNICWSPTYKKYVFIDFGFARQVSEPLGFKTKCKYKGTFRYSSPDLRKLYHLKTSGYVDLYYNDLYGMQQVFRQIKQELQEKSQTSQNILQYCFDRKQNCAQDQQDNQLTGESAFLDAIVNYFCLKYCIFSENYQNVKAITQKKNIFPCISKKLLEIERETKLLNLKNEHYNIKECIAIIEQRKQEKMIPMDNFLVTNTFIDLQNREKNSSYLSQICEEKKFDEFFNIYWWNKSHMEDIFDFLDVYFDQKKNIKDHRKALIEQIYENLFNKDLDNSLTLKMREVLLFLFEYYQKQENRLLMERIQPYFVLLNDFYEQERMEIQILSKINKYHQTLEYIHKNVQFFLGKIIFFDKCSLILKSNNEQNLVQLLQQLCKVQQSEEQRLTLQLKIFVSKIIKMMRMIKKKFLSAFLDDDLKQDNFADQMLCQFNNFDKLNWNDIIKFMNYFFVIQKQYKQANITQLFYFYFQSPYLKRCQSKLKFEYCIEKMDTVKLLRSLQEQPFMKEFPSFYHLFLEQRIMSFQLSHYITMITRHASQLSLSLPSLIFLNRKQGYKNFLMFISFYLDSIQEPSISIESNLGKLTSLFNILLTLSPINQKQNMLKNNKTLLHIQKIVKKFDKSTLISRNEMDYDQDYRHALIAKSLMYGELNLAIMYLIQERYEESIRLLIESKDKYNTLIPFGMLVRILQNVELSQVKPMIQKSVLETYEKCQKQNRVYQLCYYPDFYKIALQPYFNKNGERKCYEFIKKYLFTLQNGIHISLIFQVFEQFLKVFKNSVKESSNKVLLLFANQRLEDLRKIYRLPHLIFLLLLSFEEPLVQDNAYEKRRVIISNIFFVSHLNEGIYQNYKLKLYQKASIQRTRYQSKEQSKRMITTIKYNSYSKKKLRLIQLRLKKTKREYVQPFSMLINKLQLQNLNFRALF